MTDIKIQLSNYLSCCCQHVPPGSVSHSVIARAGDEGPHEGSQSRTFVWSSVSHGVTAPPATAACGPRSRTTRGPRVSGREGRLRQPAHCQGHLIINIVCIQVTVYSHPNLELHVVKSVVEAPLEEVGVAIVILQRSVNVVWTFRISAANRLIGEVVQSRRRPLLTFKTLLRHYVRRALTPQ